MHFASRRIEIRVKNKPIRDAPYESVKVCIFPDIGERHTFARWIWIPRVVRIRLTSSAKQNTGA
jgi:hypothetical protein